MRRIIPLMLALLAAAGCKGADADGDGFYADQDCDDDDPGAYPGAPEACDGVDNDCDGVVDDNPEDGGTWYADVDGDGFGNPEYTTQSCEQPLGYVDNADDCNDLNLLSNPEGEEWCDGEDNNCDGLVDEDGIDEGVYYVDNDGDGYGETGSVPIGACDAPDGYVENDDDCNDDDADLNPESFWYGDSDGDGFGNVLFYTQACEPPTGYVDSRNDCDDGDATAYPGAPEVCDGADNDCDGAVDDDDDDTVDQPTWYSDVDLDGYGDDSSVLVQCEAPSGAVDEGGDCDDASDAVYPGAFDDCDGLDNDCDGVIDSGCPLTIDTSDYELTGSTSSDYFAFHFEAGGDYNGDGYADVVSGAYGQDGGGSSAGASYVFFGPLTADRADTDADVKVYGVASSDYLGYAVGSALDANGDGQDDLLLGSYGSDDGASNAGAAYLWYGPLSSGQVAADSADVIVLGEADNDAMGQYLLGGGDLYNSGVDAIVLGAHSADPLGTSSGAIYVLAGPLSGVVSVTDANTTFTGQTSSDYVGYPSESHVDLNGDGITDIAYGASGTSAGSGYQEVYIFHGPLAEGSFSGADADVTIGAYETADATGSHVESGDIDGDGSPDLIIGSKYADEGGSSSGSVHGLYAPFSASMSLASDGDFMIYETSASQYFGGQYNGIDVADVDGDGVDELIAGCRSNADQGTSAGAAFFWYGPLSGTYPVTDAHRTVVGSSTSEYVGGQAAFADVTGDGNIDLLVSGRGWSSSRGHLGVWDSTRF
ncbi:MAG: putative metal-binding motif-containing protein [Alphaproteobacteria bacterium]|nr:putative metal-binding motif-containing protein [Alphaproteobacteria bacterium]MCB9794320.1 putative metal-binding motif-containing protein [Alphaproteobacteria bacterium]